MIIWLAIGTLAACGTTPVRGFAPAAATIVSSTAPSPRSSAAMAYYPPDRDVVLFGGETPTPTAGRLRSPHGLGDTWVFSGSGWHREHPADSPPARSAAALVYDPTSRLLILFGGYSARFRPTSVLADTWAWNGRDWTRLRPERTPTWMPGAPISLDARSGRITELAPRPGYPGSFAPVATFDGGRGPLGRWTYTGTTWTATSDGFVEQHPRRAPTSSALMVADERTDRATVVDAAGRVWLWTGRSWTIADPHAGPPNGGAAAYDPALGDIVVFGTDSDGIETDHTWLWDGRSWTVTR